MEYKPIVTRDRVNKYTIVLRLSALLIVVPLVIMEAASIPYELVLVVDVILSIFWFFCLSLIAYFYVKAYLAWQNWNRTRIRSVDQFVLVKEKLEKKAAYTTFWLTVVFAVSSFPTLVVYLFWGVLPFFPPDFHYTMGRNNISVKLFRQPTIVLV